MTRCCEGGLPAECREREEIGRPSGTRRSQAAAFEHAARGTKGVRGGYHGHDNRDGAG